MKDPIQVEVDIMVDRVRAAAVMEIIRVAEEKGITTLEVSALKAAMAVADEKRDWLELKARRFYDGG